ncbi:MAG: hypothetical protein H0W08_10960 [Acidobacteria bacterium]|nr:hypothetical protein [Acidobacteriota bacterium]
MNTWPYRCSLFARRGAALALAGVLVLSGACDRAPNPTGPAPELPSGSAPDGTAAAGCSRTSVGYAPLTDSAATGYQGQPGGLYPGGGNVRPAGHDAAGLGLARETGPLDRDGRPDPDGKYALVSIGMSNTTQEFSLFQEIAEADPGKDPRLVVIDAAQGGVTAGEWANPACRCWDEAERRVTSAGLSSRQVTVAWVKLANARPTEGWPGYAQRLRQDQATVLRTLKTRFPNVRLAYLSSRSYGGYATSLLNPEPYAYEGGLSVRWTIEDQLSGALTYAGETATAPWLSWGPYLWADGTTPRADGLRWVCSDFASDGVHPSDTGRRKVAELLLTFFRSDSTAREWYLRNP